MLVYHCKTSVERLQSKISSFLRRAPEKRKFSNFALHILPKSCSEHLTYKIDRVVVGSTPTLGGLSPMHSQMELSQVL
jgi:hypothetical protein